jgi:hypothetical protein
MMEKTDLLFRMMDDPGQYTDEQWREILADQECASLYEMMCKTHSALDAEQVDEQFTAETARQEWERFAAAHRVPAVKPLDWRKIAAAIVVLAVFGLTAAAIYSHFAHTPQTETVEKSTPNVNQQVTDRTEGAAHAVADKQQGQLYDDVPLEQIINDLAAHYNVHPQWHGNEVRSLRLYYKWEPDFTLDEVVEMLNNFEAFSVTLDGDQLVITQNEMMANQ